MNKKVLAIFDSEENYAYGLMEFFEEKTNLPFRIHVFTDEDKFSTYVRKDDIECLLLSENVYNAKIEQYNIPHIIILSESGALINNTLHHINKYQAIDGIYKEVIEYYTENNDDVISSIRNIKTKLKVIGIYTPIGRCLQTTFSFTLGQLLSQKSKTLYLNFERYSGLSQMLKKQFDTDISDLMYYFECAKEKLAYRVDSMVENINGLDYIPPASVYQNLAGIKGEQWIDLFMEIEKCTEYEYLILDMTDGMVDLWNVLRFCDMVYTITRGDSLALAKIEQYEKTIRKTEFVDILGKTKKYTLPTFQNIPQKFEELTKGELARFIKEKVLPEIYGLGINNEP